MFAFIPNKDSELFLAKLQDSILKDYMISNPGKIAIPSYPLYAISENEFGCIKSVIIQDAFLSDGKFAFSVQICTDENCFETQIVFGILRQKDSISKKIECDGLPKKERVFKTADIEFHDGFWETSFEKWHKTK